MIKTSVDEAVAFDMLSILMIKSTISYDIIKNVSLLHNEIKDQISNTDEIIISREFLDLYQTNLKLFDLIDEIKVRGEQLGDAIAIDSLNLERWKCKNRLQQAFFGSDKPLTEIKLGYSK